MAGTLTLTQASGFFLQLAHDLMPATHGMLEHAGQVVEDEAKRLIGTYDYDPKWPELADATKEDRVKHGFSEDEPLLRTGKLRDSIHHKVESSAHTVHIGSDEDVAVWQELGTSHIPPRTFLKGAMLNKEKELTHILGKQLHAYLSSGKFPSASGHPFNTHGEVVIP
jgi:HK97 gp10 family phage protein